MTQTQIHPCNLRTTTQAQRDAILATERAFDENPDVTLIDAMAGWDGYDGPGLPVRFHYRLLDDPDGRPGLEVTIFAADGRVIESQDFG